MDIVERAVVNMCSFDGATRGNYFGGESVRRIIVKNLKNGKEASKDGVTGDMIKRKGELVRDW